MLINPFRRSRSEGPFRTRAPAEGPFRTRAPARDHEADNQLVGQVASAIDEALQKVAAQRDGLRRRLALDHVHRRRRY
ncbi:hypothetical protein [Bradyrhizobium diazoefficiens]|uniref:hypothetical protein n=1 Tax=Bradyrhizobium diazoefficiens TaxID=1355477 RepID=UPI0038334DA8